MKKNMFFCGAAAVFSSLIMYELKTRTRTTDKYTAVLQRRYGQYCSTGSRSQSVDTYLILLLLYFVFCIFSAENLLGVFFCLDQ